MSSSTFVIVILLACAFRGAAQDSLVATVPMTFQGPVPVFEAMIN